ncbi:MAG: protein kinase [Deltaproteobacteria bacterium]|nr:protein kinase [Deltaproteobacteria bacterium]
METLPQGSDTTFEPGEGAGGREGALEPALGDVIGRYELRELLGAGGMGRVYLARDRMLGRAVAVKVVRRETVSSRFLEEAQAIAALNHPNIVHLYDVGVDRAPYLALEYIDGETLQQRCERERLSLDESLRTLRTIAIALEYVHANGVVHCDLKPGNVMLGRDGRLRVVDFGLASRVAAPGIIAGTPEWMAPEQWGGHAATAGTDVWALAVIAVRLLVGKHPFGEDVAERRELAAAGTTRLEGGDLPDGLARIIERSLEVDVALRPSAADWQAALDEMLEGRAALSSDEGPYRGLGTFGEAHARYFFGRDGEVDAFVERLRETRLLPVVGPSGAGKSSFIYAGVIPRLRARGQWTILSLRPGADPFGALARTLLDAGSAQSAAEQRSLAEDLRRTPTLLAARLSTLAGVRGGRIFLVVDQLEELFTHGASDEDAAAFVRALVAATEDPLAQVSIGCLTVREDFIGRLNGLSALFVLRRLGPAELRAAIVAPLARTGYAFEDGAIVDEMLREIGETTAALPVLQFACRALWDARDQERKLITREAYERLGGAVGALGRHADGVLAELSPAELRAARPLLLALVVGTTRRQVERAQLLARVPDGARVLDRLIAARLLVQRGEDNVVELAHESLLATWGQLARWIDETRDERRVLDELEEASALWVRRNRRDDDLWRAAELAAFHHRRAQLQLVVPAHLEEFLRASAAREDRARRRARLRWIFFAALAALVTTGSAYLALVFRQQKVDAQHANVNLGRVEIALRPFDWVNGVRTPVAVEQLPALSWRLHDRQPEGHEPGAPIADVRAEPLVVSGPELVARVDVRGGAAYLRIDGRARAGEPSCAPSWVRIQSLPGYSERAGAVTRLEIPVPTCRATRDDMIAIPAGTFIYGGPGDPPTTLAGEFLEREREIDLHEFAIDRTEVSNARFAPYAEIAAITNYPVPIYPPAGPLEHAGDPDRPLAGLDAFAAEALCRYYGKRLPSDHEWVKAARGGLVVGGEVNPAPRRLYPWGGEPRPRCANLLGEADGYEWTAPVDALGCGDSPYGVRQLVGNVAEIISYQAGVEGSSARHSRGGGAESPIVLEHGTTVYRNQHEARQFAYSLGVRCVADGPPGLVSWNGQ